MMSNASPTSDSSSSSLFDPSPPNPVASNGSEEETSGGYPETEDTDTVDLEISKEVAERLRKVAVQLGLPPGVLASRAIDLICDQVGTAPDEKRSPNHLVKRYQARLDLLHAVQKDGVESSSGDEPAQTPSVENRQWREVEKIIDTGEQSRD